MIKKISQVILVIGICALVLASCKNQKNKNGEDQTQTEMKSAGASEGDSLTNSNSKTEPLITENEGSYVRQDLNLFEEGGEVADRLKKLAGDHYDSIVDNYETETPIAQDEGVYKFTGCKQHDCPSFLTTILYDSQDNNFNIIVDKDGKVKTYQEKGKIEMTDALKSK